jgi:single-strand DNA-binding protein
MNWCTVALTGKLASEVSRHETANGRIVVRFRVIVPDRRIDRLTNRVVDRDPTYVTAVAWGATADAVANTLRRGDQVVLSGNLRVRQWRNSDGDHRSTTEVTVTAIGRNLVEAADPSATGIPRSTAASECFQHDQTPGLMAVG